MPVSEVAEQATYWLRARGLVGTPYRLQGREPGVGLDCVGLVAQVYRLPAEQVPFRYRVRSGSWARVDEQLERWFEPDRTGGAPRSGSLLALRLTQDRAHFAVAGPHAHVHADLGLRRVVETPGLPDAEALQVWQLKPLFWRT